jgi:AcrR family transcriptional regulator
MRMIAQRCGIAAASIYNHAESKESLLVDIMSNAMAHMRSNVNSVRSIDCSAGRTATLVCLHAQYHSQHKREALVGNTEISSLSAPNQRQVLDERREYETALREGIDEGRREGYFCVRDSKMASFAILQMGIGIGTWFRSDGEYGVDQIGELYARYALRLCGFDHKVHARACTAVRCAAKLMCEELRSCHAQLNDSEPRAPLFGG